MWHLRPATPADQAFMDGLHAAVLVQSWGLPEGPLDPALQGVVDAQCRWREEAYRRAHPASGCQLICAADGTPLGRIWTDRGSTLYLVDLAVLPARQGRGIGRWALTRLQDEARRLGLALTLDVAADNPSRRLYERLGWVATGLTGQHQQMRWTPTPLVPTD